VFPLGGQLFTELGNTFLFSLPDVEIFLGFLTATEGVSSSIASVSYASGGTLGISSVHYEGGGRAESGSSWESCDSPGESDS